MAILSAVIGAVGAGVPTVVVAHMQVAAAEENTRQSFAREQRYEAYARLKDAVVNLQAQEQKCVDVIGESRGFVPLPSTTAEIDRIHEEVRSAYQEVRKAAARIDSSIAAPDEVIRLAQELVSSQSVTVRSMVETPSSAYGRQDSQLDQVRANMTRSFEAYQRFSRAAGEELQPG